MGSSHIVMTPRGQRVTAGISIIAVQIDSEKESFSYTRLSHGPAKPKQSSEPWMNDQTVCIYIYIPFISCGGKPPLNCTTLFCPTAVPFHVEPDMTLQLCNLVVNLPGNAVLTTHKHIPWTPLTTCYCCGNVGVIVFVYRKNKKTHTNERDLIWSVGYQYRVRMCHGLK